MTKHMKTLVLIASSSAALLAVAWAADPPPVPSAPPVGQASGEEVEASCLLKITSDPAVFPLEPAILQYLLATSGVKDDAIKEFIHDTANVEITLELVGGGGITTSVQPGGPRGPQAGGGMGAGGPGLGPTGAPGGRGLMGGMGGPYGGGGGVAGAVPVALPDSSEQMLVGHLKVVSQDQKHARQIMVAVTKRFQAALEKVGTEERGRLDRELAAAARQVEESRMRMEQLHKLRQEMLSGTPFNDLSRESVLEMSRKFETERQEASVKLESLRARNEAFQKHIAEVGAVAKEMMAKQQAQVAEAQSLKARLEELQAKQEELKKKSELLREAQEQLKQRNDQIKDATQALAQLEATMTLYPPGARMSELNDQMSKSSIDLAETEVRLKVLDAKCKEMRELLSKADEFELRVGLELPLARSTYENARMRQRDIEYRMSAIHPPTVSVIGG